MRLATALLALGPLLVSGAAWSNPQCELYTRNIAHYEQTAARMEAADKDVWADKTREHIQTLERKREELCPEYSADAQAAQAFRDMLRFAGKAALTYFTFGAF